MDPFDSQPKPFDPSTLQLAGTPIQVGNEIKVAITVADQWGIGIQLVLSQLAAKELSKLIKETVERAEVQIIQPPSALIS